MVPGFRSAAIIFPKMFMIGCCTVLVELPVTSSLPSFAWCRSVNISEAGRDVPEWRAPFLFSLGGLSSERRLFFAS